MLIRIQQYKINADPSGSGSTTLYSTGDSLQRSKSLRKGERKGSGGTSSHLIKKFHSLRKDAAYQQPAGNFMHRRTNTGEDIFIQATELEYLYVRNLHGMPSYFFIEPLRPHPPPHTDKK